MAKLKIAKTVFFCYCVTNLATINSQTKIGKWAKGCAMLKKHELLKSTEHCQSAANVLQLNNLTFLVVVCEIYCAKKQLSRQKHPARKVAMNGRDSAMAGPRRGRWVVEMVPFCSISQGSNRWDDTDAEG